MIYHSFIIIIFFFKLQLFTLSIYRYIDGVSRCLVTMIDINYERSFLYISV